MCTDHDTHCHHKAIIACIVKDYIKDTASDSFI